MMAKSALPWLLAGVVGIALGLGAYFAFHAGLVLSVLLVVGVTVIVGFTAHVVGVLTKSEGLP